jgi:PAS domain S-box-containing protein
MERRLLESAPQKVVLFQNVTGNREAVQPIRDGDRTLGYAWVAENPASEQQEVRDLVRVTALAAVLGAIGCLLASTWLARSITRPLKMVMDATRRLIRDPETKQGFPLDVPETNEAGELAEAFNLLVLSMEDQRSGLNDTLALLDSMLAHAPIGFAFLDRQGRFIRVNNFLANGMGIPLTRFLGQTPEELFGREQGEAMQARLARIFQGTRAEEEPRNADGAGGRGGYGVETFELPVPDDAGAMRSWLVNMYPVKSGQQEVRWVGTVMIDTTERRRSEDALRRTEKLAAAGQLAASIAHEINNPLEAVGNLLFLALNEHAVPPGAMRYLQMANEELRRVGHIVSQTLGFYRESNVRQPIDLGMLVNDVLSLYQRKLDARQIRVTRQMESGAVVDGIAGELRQVLANLLANALDAMEPNGVLGVAVEAAQQEARITISDTGHGIAPALLGHIFEPFFTTKEDAGTGLGLWVSKGIAEKHDGRLEVASSQGREDHGTAFVLTLPRRTALPLTA